jgi:ribonuclease Z
MLGIAWTGKAIDRMRITLLGTGTPFPTPERFGSAILVEAGSKKLLFDCGRGAVIRLTEAGVNPREIDGLFLTHLHSDHVVGVPDLWLSGWFLGRDRPLRIWGPSGTRSMVEHLIQAFSFDIHTRVAAPEGLPARGAEIEATEIREGMVFDDGSVRVSAFVVDHGAVAPAFGYRVDYSTHSVVISGDTKFSQNLVDFAKGADCLIHVAWSIEAMNRTPLSLRSLASGEDAGRAFAAVNPQLGVIYHYQNEKGLLEVIHGRYKGRFIVAKDLTVINIGRTVSYENKFSQAQTVRR